MSFASYAALWREKRADRARNGSTRTLMSYDHDVGLAATWATSVEKLSRESRRLLERLAFLGPDPIPELRCSKSSFRARRRIVMRTKRAPASTTIR